MNPKTQLRVDEFINSVSIGFVGVQFLLGAFAATGFPRDGMGGNRGGPKRVIGGAGPGAGGTVTYVGSGPAAGAVPAAQPAAPTFVIGGGGGGGGAQGR